MLLAKGLGQTPGTYLPHTVDGTGETVIGDGCISCLDGPQRLTVREEWVKVGCVWALQLDLVGAECGFLLVFILLLPRAKAFSNFLFLFTKHNNKTKNKICFAQGKGKV